MARLSADERYRLGFVECKESGCWVWQRDVSGYGYASFWADGKKIAVHRWAHQRFVGPIPDGYQVDHLCKNTRCVNPDHLEAVTQRENTLRNGGPTALAARKTHCYHGHELPAEHWHREGNRMRRRRRCKRCSADAQARLRQRRKAAA